MSKCPNCGAPMEANKCPYCQYEDFTNNENNSSINISNITITTFEDGNRSYLANSSNYSKWTALILCLLLGPFGAHQFYVKKTFTGFVYLFTAGILGIGWLYDIIRIFSGQFKDYMGLPLKQ